MSLSLAPMKSPTAPTSGSERGTLYYDADSGSKDHVAHAGSTDTVTAAGARRQPRLTDPGSRIPSGYTADQSDVPENDFTAGKSGDAHATDVSRNTTTGSRKSRNSVKSTTNETNTGRGIAFAENGGDANTNNHDAKDFAYMNGAKSPSPEREGSLASATGSVSRRQRASGAFNGGAALNSPDARPDEDPTQHQRRASAEGALPENAKSKINKAEVKDAKRLTKVIKAEGKAQSKTVTAALDELTSLQKLQKQAAVDEARARKAQTKSAKAAHKLQAKYLEAKSRWEHAEADLKARGEQLEASRAHAQKVTQQLADTAKEVEELRAAKNVDDREREAKLRELANIGKAPKVN